jgi:hypothetical protein
VLLIQVEARQCVAQRFALGGNKEPMHLLFKRVEILYGLVGCAMLTPKVLKMIRGMGITGQAVTVLQCLHWGSPPV